MHLRLRDLGTILRRALVDAREDGLPLTAQALAYSLFLAIPATMLVVLGVFSLVADPDAISRLVDRAETVIPSEAATLLDESLQRSARSTGGSIAMTVVGFLLAIWATTSAATSLTTGLTKAYDRHDERSFLRKRLVALAIVGCLLLSALLVVGLLVLGPHVERWVGRATGAEAVTAWAWWTAQWPILPLGLFAAFVAVLVLGPDVEHDRWQVVVPGAVVAVLVWLAASAGFALYTANFASYNKSWGTLSAVVITLVWLWLSGAALLFGAEVNAEAAKLTAERERARHTAEPTGSSGA